MPHASYKHIGFLQTMLDPDMEGQVSYLELVEAVNHCQGIIKEMANYNRAEVPAPLEDLSAFFIANANEVNSRFVCGMWCVTELCH